MERVRLDLVFDDNVYAPGDYVSGSVRLHGPYDVPADCLRVAFHGKAAVKFQEYEKTQTYLAEKIIVDEESVLWKHVPAADLLDIASAAAAAAAAASSTTTPALKSPSFHKFRFRVPFNAATSFSAPNSPAHVKYSLKAELSLFSDVLYSAESPIAIVARTRIHRALAEKKITHSKTFAFSKGRSIVVDCHLGKSVFTPVEKIPIEICILNRWKQSIKFVRLSIVRRVCCEGALENYDDVKLRKVFDQPGAAVGLPPCIPKIPINERVVFKPEFYLSALVPTLSVDSLLSVEWFLKLSLGRAHNFVVAEMALPITVVTEFVDVDVNENDASTQCHAEAQIDADMPLIQFSTPSPYNPFLSPGVIDMLA